jgi:DNA-binding NarL/FixJ family response regulator
MGAGKIRVAVVHGRDALGEGLAIHLRDEADLDVIVAVPTAADARRSLTGHGLDVFVVGKDLPDGDGIDVTAELRTLCPEARTVMLAEGEDASDVTAALRAGASAWVTYASSAQKLLDAVRGVAMGETWISARVLTDVLGALMHKEESAHRGDEVRALLTSREREVLLCMAEGLDRNEIAVRLHLSANTVRTHTQKVMSKLDVHTSLAAAATARRVGLAVPPPDTLLSGR